MTTQVNLRHSLCRRESRWSRLPLLPLLLLFGLTITRNAWLSDDAYITFRTVDNFVNGYGLTWNPVERVQAYTHPLWMFLLSALYSITREIHISSLALSIAISLVAAWLLACRINDSPISAAASIALLTLSKAFVDYSTSGLENPLSHLLIVAFLLGYAKRPWSTRRLLCLALLAALGTVNRMDLALIFIPPLGYVLWKGNGRWEHKLLATCGGMLPLALWELFSLFYYGFPFPNTAYAKLNLGIITPGELLTHGLHYFANSLEWDRVTLFTIAWGTVWGIVEAVRTGNSWSWPLSLGNLLYLLYVVRIGGDFMSGRFFTAPLLVALSPLASTQLKELKPSWKFALASLLSLAVYLGLSGPYSPVRFGPVEGAGMDEYGIADEQGCYWHNTSLVQLGHGKELPDHDWALEGRAARRSNPGVVVKGSVGFYGYFAGPQVYVVDLLGLGDPLLARLPPIDPQWRIGHYGRRPPPGYLDTLSTGKNLIRDPNLALYYEKLSLIIRGPLLAPERLAEILRFNLGLYNRYLNNYALFEGEQFVHRLRLINPEGAPYVYALVWNKDGGTVVLLDDASQQGKVYTVTWTITATGATIAEPYKAQLSSLKGLDDSSTLNIGVVFSHSTDLSDYQIFEYRHRFRLQDGHLTILRQGIGWHNAHAPGGVWMEEEIGGVITATDEDQVVAPKAMPLPHPGSAG